MTRSPLLWGAGLVCALGGAVAGTALGSAPILDRPSYGAYYQSHEASAPRPSNGRETPDHYPLVTRQGTVPVAELSERGLFSQARYRDAYDEAPLTPAAVAEAVYDPDADGARWAAGDAAPTVAEQPQPDVVVSVPAGLTQPGQAKTVDVSAVLAMR